MNIELNKKIIEQIRLLVQRPKMLASIPDYWAFESYLHGVFAGVKLASGVDYYREFLSYLDTKYPKRKKELAFSSWIYYLNNEDLQKAREQLEQVLLDWCNKLENH